MYILLETRASKNTQENDLVLPPNPAQAPPHRN